MQLRAKFILLAVLPLVASLILIALAVRHQERELVQREHALVEQAYMEARRAELKAYVALAVSTVKPLYEAPGDPLAQRAQALQLLASLDYGPDGYFFVYDLQGNSLMHSRQPELVGRNLWDMRDPQGRPTIQELIAQARQGGGFVDYLWRRPSNGQVEAKLGYVVPLERWGWMIGTGLYLGDIQATMAQLDAQASSNIATTLLWIAGIAVFGVALISSTSLLLNVSEQRVADAKLRLLAHQVVQSQEDERAHLARELHDGTSQTLVATKLLVESAVDALEAGRPLPARVLATALERLKASLDEVRRISHRLRPALLDSLGLPAALETLGREFEDDGGAEQVEVSVQGEPVELPELVKTVLFRVAQEALTNAAKHAAAVHLRLSLSFEPGRVRLQISDDGAGFDEAAVQEHPRQGIGLRNMRERLASIGGRLQIRSQPGAGTEVWAEVPLFLNPASTASA
ncbi:cache domain-containing protein [Paucibacter sp. AS339]|uniref:cache domain-containing protein n=1 Tax=Paucibacter hankyongi TaxID=3133434 RepID=UPI0030B314BF